ncbi:hypothetical protein PVAP13_7KG299800 [Panicum virgatum]|uniref:Uncharacterized protein n=1 Tax=Panicum virgatum TaxID=38727 RepID=A0A8T0QHH8_PANVG|nr:hypothetical protein PVAP13_7KG299800 [Panicum virgatum]
MDPPAPSPRPPAGEGGQQEERSRRRPRSALRGALGVAFPIAASFLFSFLVGLAGLALGGLSSTASVSMPSTCRILSTGVDLRSSKVCELGLLNYRAKHVFYRSSKRRFRCQDDYYWASVFQVNESYSCRYTLGSNKADIHSDKLLNCTAEEPSTREILKRILTLFSESNVSENFSSKQMLGYVAAGVLLGMLSSMFITVLFRGCCGLLLAAARWAVRKYSIRVFAGRLKRACLLVAYVSAVGWIT